MRRREGSRAARVRRRLAAAPAPARASGAVMLAFTGLLLPGLLLLHSGRLPAAQPARTPRRWCARWSCARSCTRRRSWSARPPLRAGAGAARRTPRPRRRGVGRGVGEEGRRRFEGASPSSSSAPRRRRRRSTPHDARRRTTPARSGVTSGSRRPRAAPADRRPLAAPADAVRRGGLFAERADVSGDRRRAGLGGAERRLPRQGGMDRRSTRAQTATRRRHPPPGPQHHQRHGHGREHARRGDDEGQLVAGDQGVVGGEALCGQGLGAVGRDGAERGQAERSGDVERDVDQGRGHAGVAGGHVGHRDRQQRHERRPRTEAHEQEGHEDRREVRIAGAGGREDEQPAGHDDQAREQRPSGAEAPHELRGRADREGGDDERPGQEGLARGDRAVALHALEVQGAQEEAPVHPHAHHRPDDARARPACACAAGATAGSGSPGAPRARGTRRARRRPPSRSRACAATPSRSGAPRRWRRRRAPWPR